MAVWQCDFFLLSRPRVIDYFGYVPISIEEGTFSETNWWGNYQPSKDYERFISSFLVRHESWDKNLMTWGDEDGNRIDVWLREEQVQEIIFRLDARDVDLHIIKCVCAFSISCNAIILSSGMRLVEPRGEMLFSELEKSGAYRFVNNPHGFLEDVARKKMPS